MCCNLLLTDGTKLVGIRLRLDKQEGEGDELGYLRCPAVVEEMDPADPVGGRGGGGGGVADGVQGRRTEGDEWGIWRWMDGGPLSKEREGLLRLDGSKGASTASAFRPPQFIQCGRGAGRLLKQVQGEVLLLPQQMPPPCRLP